MRSTFRLLCLILAGLSLAVPAAAQSGDEVTGPMVAGGVSFLVDKNTNTRRIAPGLTLDAMVKSLSLADTLEMGVVAQFGFNQLDGRGATNIQGGLRFLLKGDPRMTPYVQIAVGTWRCCGASYFMFEPGGGVDVPLSPRWNLRGAAGFMRIRKDGGFFTEIRIWGGFSYLLKAPKSGG